MESIQDVIVKVRNIRSEMSVDAKKPVRLRIATENPGVAKVLQGAREYIFRLATVGELEIVSRLEGNKLAAQAVAAGCTLEVPLEGLIDTQAEKARLQRELDKVLREVEGLERKLSNTSFLERAPAEVVDEIRHRLSDYQDQGSKLRSALDRLA
jgi:valyl-tRNA synthetase